MQKQYRQKHKGREQKECEQDKEEEQEDGCDLKSDSVSRWLKFQPSTMAVYL